jgi:hypothetical protein
MTVNAGNLQVPGVLAMREGDRLLGFVALLVTR